MSDKHDWEKFRHILTLYQSFCNNCGQDISSKNGIETKSHNCQTMVRSVSVRPIPFCIICLGMLSLEPRKKLEIHCRAHAPLFNQSSPIISKMGLNKLEINEDLFKVLSSNFDDLVSSNEMDSHRINEAIKENLTTIISRQFPEVRVYIYGSREIGTGSRSSDLDVYVDIDQSYHTLGLDKSVMTTLEKVAHILKNNSDVWDKIIIIKAKTPIIQAYNKIEDINCDISFSDGIGHSTTQLMKTLCDKQPIFRGMMIVLGKWLDAIEMTNCINKYTLRLLILYYLQCIRFVPSIRNLQKDISSPSKIGEWIVSYDERKITNRCGDLEQHIKGFFNVQNKAKRFDGIISTYAASRVHYHQLKTDFFNSYNTFINKYGNNEAYSVSSMNVQGPFNLAGNPAKQVSQKDLEKFINYSRLSYLYLNIKK